MPFDRSLKYVERHAEEKISVVIIFQGFRLNLFATYSVLNEGNGQMFQELTESVSAVM